MTNKFSIQSIAKRFVNYSYERTILNSSLFSVILFFSILYIGSLLQPTVYPLLDRVTYSTPFVDMYVINSDLDKMIILILTALWLLFSIKNTQKYLMLGVYASLALVAMTFQTSIISDLVTIASLPFLVMLIFLSKIRKINFLSINESEYVSAIAILMLVIASLALVISLAYISMPNIILPPLNYFYYLYLELSLFSPLLLVTIGLYSEFKLIHRMVKNRRLENKNVGRVVSQRKEGYLNLKARFIFMLGIFSLTWFIIAIPHLHTINPDSQVIGADTIDYVNYLRSMNDPSTFQEFKESFILLFEGDRALSLVTFYTISQFLPISDLIHAMDLLPFVLAPLFILSIYFLTREITSNHTTSLLAALISGVSFHTLVGVYGGLYANWYSLIFVNLSILFFVRTIRKLSALNLFTFSILLVVVLITHEPTWPILVLGLLISLIFFVYTNRDAKKTAISLLFSMLPSFIIELIRMTYTKNAGVIRDINYASEQGFGIHDWETTWNNLITTTQTYLAGQFGNSIIYLLVIYWLFNNDLKNITNIVILAFLTLPLIPIFFGDSVIMSRVLFEIPFQIPAAIALTSIMNHKGKLIVYTICVWLIVIAIRTSSNFYFDT